ncbi:hypothetical protein ABT173_28360 [Streptomyces sp. NPDC001795]|uniref:hypothetical protein n=1 Tax=Streptomyces sp. NPDC001795 TaxID=3154525 RepID=UPI00332733B9
MRICTVIGATAIVATATAGGQHAFAAEGRSTPAAAARSHPKAAIAPVEAQAGSEG